LTELASNVVVDKIENPDQSPCWRLRNPKTRPIHPASQTAPIDTCSQYSVK